MAAKAGGMQGAHSLGATQTLTVTSLHSHDQVWVPVAACVKEGPALARPQGHEGQLRNGVESLPLAVGNRGREKGQN